MYEEKIKKKKKKKRKERFRVTGLGGFFYDILSEGRALGHLEFARKQRERKNLLVASSMCWLGWTDHLFFSGMEDVSCFAYIHPCK